jgi:hypothetical protein
MQNIVIPLGAPSKDRDAENLVGNLAYIKNGIRDGDNGIVSLAGRKLFCDLGINKRVDGIHYSSQKRAGTSESFAYAVCGGEIFTLNDQHGSFAQITTTPLLQSQVKTTFTELFEGATVYSYFANGGKIVYSLAGGTPAVHPSANAPDRCSHVAGYDTYLIFNVLGTNTFGFSNPKLPMTIDTADNYDAEMMVDDIRAISVFNRRLFLFGDNSIETWINQGTAGDPLLRRLSASYVENGLLSPDCLSVVDINGVYVQIFMDKRRRVCAISGDAVEVLSKEYDRFINELAVVSDAVSFIISYENTTLFCISFPSANITIAYDLKKNQWYELGKFNHLLSYDIYDGFCGEYIPTWGKYLVGGEEGKIWEISNRYFTENNEPIGFSFETGHINHGSDRVQKKCVGLSARIKRGKTLFSAPGVEPLEPTLMFRWQDDGRNEWSNWKSVSLGALGDTEIVKDLFNSRGGIYRTRKYQFACSDTVGVGIYDLFEQVEVVDRNG